MLRAASMKRLEAYLELPHREGLHEIIIRARLETLHLVLQLVSCSQHQHWRRFLTLLAQLTTNTEPVERREHEVENYDVIVVGHGQMKPRDAIRSVVEGMAFRLEIVSDVLGNVSMVLNYEYPHAALVRFARVYLIIVKISCQVLKPPSR